MRKASGRVVAVFITLVVCLVAQAAPALASGGTIKDVYKGTVKLACEQNGYGSYYAFSIPSGKLTKVKSYNKKVVEAEYCNDGTSRYLSLWCKKAGKAKVAYVYKGKKHKVTIQVVKWKNPVKKLAIGSKNYASYFKKEGNKLLYEQAGKNTIRGKTIKVKPAEGWKVAEIVCERDYPSAKRSTIKNGGKMPKWTEAVRVRLVNKSSGLAEEVRVAAYLRGE